MKNQVNSVDKIKLRQTPPSSPRFSKEKGKGKSVTGRGFFPNYPFPSGKEIDRLIDYVLWFVVVVMWCTCCEECGWIAYIYIYIFFFWVCFGFGFGFAWSGVEWDVLSYSFSLFYLLPIGERRVSSQGM